MTKENIIVTLIIASILILLLAGLVVVMTLKSTYRNFKNQEKRLTESLPASESELITSEDLAPLPEPVRRYLEYTGAVGTEKVKFFTAEIDGDFKMSPDRDWAPVQVEQISFIENPARLFFMKLKFMGLKIFGLHHYESAKATMVVKVLDLFKAADARGPEMNKGETVTVFNDMCVFVPSSLIDSRISWHEIDNLTAEGTFTNGGISVTAVLYFNESGQLVNFISEDRYYLNEDGTYELLRWATPLIEYRENNGLNIASYGEAVWLRDGSEYSYARFNIRDVRVNPVRY